MGNTNLQTGNYNILIGSGVDTLSSSTSKFLNIGDLIFGTGIGTTATTPSGGLVGIGSNAPRTSLDLSQNTDAVIVPIGTTTQRPATGVNGMIRYNSTNTGLEAYVNNAWAPIVTQTALVTSSTGASPETATCAAGYVLTGCTCKDATVADACSSTPTAGLAGTCVATSSAGNVTAYATCGR